MEKTLPQKRYPQLIEVLEIMLNSLGLYQQQHLI